MDIKFRNYTHNQHYISQAEQRANAIDGEKGESKIYLFTRNNENGGYSCDKKKIKKNFAIDHLYTFFEDKKDENNKKVFYNFEKFFQNYEQNVIKNTENLLKKLKSCDPKDIHQDFMELAYAKYMNIMRNPYCINIILRHKSILDILNKGEHIDIVRKIENTNGLNIENICNTLNIQKSTYIDWLKIIFAMMVESDNEKNLLETMVDSIFSNKRFRVTIKVLSFCNDICLLSDKGFCEKEEDNRLYTIWFNLNKNNLMAISFRDLKRECDFFRRVSEQAANSYKREMENSEKENRVFFHEDALSSLQEYNTLVVNNSVIGFCGAHRSKIYGVDVFI